MSELQDQEYFAQIINIKPLFDGDPESTAATVEGLGMALQEDGVFVAVGLPKCSDLERRATALFAFFELSEAENFAPYLFPPKDDDNVPVAGTATSTTQLPL